MKNKNVTKIISQIFIIVITGVSLDFIYKKIASFLEQSNNPWIKDFSLLMLGLALVSILIGIQKGKISPNKRMFLWIYYGSYSLFCLYLFISYLYPGLGLPLWVYIASIVFFIFFEIASSINYGGPDYN